MNLAFLSPDAGLEHDNGPGHPECPERLTAIRDQLVAGGLDPWILHREALPAGRTDLRRVHAGAHIDRVLRHVPAGERVMLDGDTALSPGSHEAALLAAGAGMTAVDWVMGAENRRAFCAVRPPGHHARADRAAGFCLFNNVVIAARHAQARHSIRRIAIVDFDVHHGDGTESLVAGDPSILFASSFEHPAYPGSGVTPLGDNCLNVPVPGGSSGGQWREAVAAAWFERWDAFAPELVLVSAGFDAHREDELSRLALSEDDYAWITARIVELAERHAQGRVVSMLEGGYALHALGRSAVAHMRELGGL
ncbi:histone deacetylase family protein [Thioalkalivibrio halophilus]|uniref:Deacetylase n=1 Tax=Thioalkalivibrio halophilus TaxID=252474 RepID=A0A1V2ZXT2_9GAMM|nr:histone deacetylase family protein [Thioalkalivibrio halophilus]OOC09885.1 deacetylase [Thioalkalivibrio halophilus]